LYDELIKNYNQANEGALSPMAQLHNDSGTCLQILFVIGFIDIVLTNT